MPKHIRKRDGNVVAFSSDKIVRALNKGFASTGEGSEETAERLAKHIFDRLEAIQAHNPGFVPEVEQVQDLVELSLIEEGLAKTAKAYILYREDHRQVREVQRQILNGRTTKLPFALNALRVIAKRYLQLDADGNVAETPEEMYRRVAVSLAKVEERYGKDAQEVERWTEKFYDILTNFEFTPAGRTITNAGASTPVVANCIVLHFEDNMTSIFETLKEASLLQQQGSGLGFAFHLLRPAGMKAKRTQGRSSGPVSFLNVYNTAFGIIQQQNRHGANMAVMRVDHPDILDFIHCKEKEGSIVNFNISVGFTDAFMSAVESNDQNPWMCEWNGVKMYPRRIKRNSRGIVEEIIEEKMTAREIFDEIIAGAWNNGEPGCVFLDEVNRTNPVPGLGRLETCNPCGEQFLHNGDVCNLGSINLARFAKRGQLDEARLRHVTAVATRMLDNVIDSYGFAVDRVQQTAKGNRRIGLGIMGFADLLYQLKIGYNTPEGFAMAERVMGIIQDESHKTSQALANEKGMFPNWPLSVFAEKGIRMRNAALTTVAPTGTIAMMFDAGSGVEPFFALAYKKENILGGKASLSYVNKYLEAELKERGLYREEILSQISEEGTLQNIPEIPADMKRVFVTAMDINAEDHIRIQAAFQKHVDNSISKTCNFRNDATHDDIRQGYILGWKLGCKGLTVYRDGSREVQILNLNKKKEKPVEGTVSHFAEASRDAAVAAPKQYVEVVSGVSLDQTPASTPTPVPEHVHVSAPAAPVAAFGGTMAAPVMAVPSITAPVRERMNEHAMKVADKIKAGLCPECDTTLLKLEGCKSCPSCGWALCSL
ncbi:MAG: adenosylcobalamin-dependent ribonucleoside-diphosphate reductase [Candidatus Andersenbacteria bacterium]|nr:adenosylcobalamin-dependent ribonucleoside-diphosphate reductase [Candidatus Andersenbacteria bacterium]